MGHVSSDDNDRAFIATNLGVWSTDNLNGAATGMGARNRASFCTMRHAGPPGQYENTGEYFYMAVEYGRLPPAAAPTFYPLFSVPASLITSEQPDQDNGLPAI